MVRRSAQRLTTTLLVVLSLLFSQLALANYVCPDSPQKPPVPAMQMASGEPCEGMGMDAGKPMDQEQPSLCYQHCASAPQSADPVQVPAVSLPAVVQVLVVPLVLDGVDAESAHFAEVGRARPPADPLFLSTHRLRV